MTGETEPSDAIGHILALAALLPAAQRSAYEYAASVDLFSGSAEITAAHPAGRAYLVATKIALIQSEASEALQEIRSEQTDLDPSARRPNDALSLELADIVIRVLELAEDLGVDLGGALVSKTRATLSHYRHGGMRF
jgi:NTP pyrophosphatase (non-canonical NTP hydrolase)